MEFSKTIFLLSLDVGGRSNMSMKTSLKKYGSYDLGQFFLNHVFDKQKLKWEKNVLQNA